MASILCVDDHAPTLQTLCWLLEANGYHCLSAASGKDGLRLFRENDVDLLIVDNTLEEGSGAELARQCKQLRPVPVLMLSGWSDGDRPEHVDVYMTKPQEPRELLAAVLSLIVRARSATV